MRRSLEVVNPPMDQTQSTFGFNSRWLLGFCACLLATTAPAQRIPGITVPVRQVQLSAMVPGTVDRVLVEEGAVVNAGDLLVELDKRMELLEVERRKLIFESKAELEAAQMRRALLKAEWETTLRLFESTRSVSQEDRDRKELEYKLAAADLARIEALELQEDVEYRMANEQLRRREIRAPFDGVVTAVFLKEGEGCDPRQPLVALVDASECEFICNIPVSVTGALQLGSKVSMEIESGDGALLRREATVSFVSPVVDPASGLREIRARFPNPDGVIAPGVTGVLLLGDAAGD